MPTWIQIAMQIYLGCLAVIVGCVVALCIGMALDGVAGLLFRLRNPASRQWRGSREARGVQSDRGGCRDVDPNAVRPQVSPQGTIRR